MQCNCEVGDDGTKAFAKVLKFNSSLRDLNLVRFLFVSYFCVCAGCWFALSARCVLSSVRVTCGIHLEQ